jgi:hypothetical protein
VIIYIWGPKWHTFTKFRIFGWSHPLPPPLEQFLHLYDFNDTMYTRFYIQNVNLCRKLSLTNGNIILVITQYAYSKQTQHSCVLQNCCHVLLYFVTMIVRIIGGIVLTKMITDNKSFFFDSNCVCCQYFLHAMNRVLARFCRTCQPSPCATPPKLTLA